MSTHVAPIQRNGVLLRPGVQAGVAGGHVPDLHRRAVPVSIDRGVISGLAQSVAEQQLRHAILVDVVEHIGAADLPDLQNNGIGVVVRAVRVTQGPHLPCQVHQKGSIGHLPVRIHWLFRRFRLLLRLCGFFLGDHRFLLFRCLCRLSPAGRQQQAHGQRHTYPFFHRSHLTFKLTSVYQPRSCQKLQICYKS